MKSNATVTDNKSSIRLKFHFLFQIVQRPRKKFIKKSAWSLHTAASAQMKNLSSLGIKIGIDLLNWDLVIVLIGKCQEYRNVNIVKCRL